MRKTLPDTQRLRSSTRKAFRHHDSCATDQPERLAGRGPLAGFESFFYKSQRKVERKHFRDRKILLYHEKEHQKIQRAMSQDPYLDTAGLEAANVDGRQPILTRAPKRRAFSNPEPWIA